MDQSFDEQLRETRDATTQKLAAAHARLRTALQEVDGLKRAEAAYNTIIEQREREAKGLLPSRTLLDDETFSEVVPNGVVPRRPEYRDVANLREAVQRHIRANPQEQSNEAFVSAIYEIKTPEDMAKARRTLNAELSRAVARGDLRRVGRGRYALRAE